MIVTNAQEEDVNGGNPAADDGKMSNPDKSDHQVSSGSRERQKISLAPRRGVGGSRFK